MEAVISVSMMGKGLGVLKQRSVWRDLGLVSVGRRKMGRVLGVGMSKEMRERRPQNVDGEFYVDHTCIDCDTCRWMAPKSFTRVGEKSAVYKQPSSREERLEALQALLSCPTSSIHTEKPPHDIKEVQKTFPIPIDGQRIPGIYHCGYHSVKSYAASSYFIVHPEGNILVDSPKYTEALARNLEELGGVRFMFLTHKDDVADHEKWSKRFNCERILHSLEVQESTVGVERKLEGAGPWSLYPDIELIFAPGHTEGSVCLYHKSLKVLFTGDHLMLWGSKLDIVEAVNWFSVPLQLERVKNLLDVDFEWVLPGHGRRASFRDAGEKNLAIEALLDSKLQKSK